ncbi:hypothetical protein [Egicoccus sp. AB-alg2]|uniref:hypothetical protein n=1 Tax=Egicoccus sp. AB-alg2 TaxID=3242693 RepID=UPI00359CD39E
MDDAVLAGLREIAAREGRALEDVVAEALQSYVAAHRTRPRSEVLAHLEASIDEHGELYRRLAE